MRVTNSMLVSNFMNNLNTNTNKLSKLQNQLATNRKFANISDDPVSVIYAQQARYKLNRLSDYQQNVSIAQEWLTDVETNVMELNEIMKSAYEACISASTDVISDTGKTSTAEYVKQLRDQVVHTLNSTFGDKFIYGGYNTTGKMDNNKVVAPFTVEGDKLCFNGIEVNKANLDAIDSQLQEMRKDVLTFDVGVGIDMSVTYNGLDMVLFEGDTDRNIYSLLDDLYKGLAAAKPAEDINKSIKPLQEAQSYLLGIAAEIGGKTNRLEILASRYEADEINYTQMKSDAEDADQAEVIMNYKMAEAVYKAALSAGSYIIQPTLMDFLR